MASMRTILTFLGVVALLSMLAACAPTPTPPAIEETPTSEEGAVHEEQVTARTYYESLDLATPEGAVHEFCAAFQRRDYATVFEVLHPRAQFWFVQWTNLLMYEMLVKEEFETEVIQDVCLIREGLGNCDYIVNSTYLFDDFMLAAEQHSAFLIDLRGRETIIGTRRARTYQDEDAVDVIATVEEITGEVVFRTVQVPSGRWRVLQVIVPGGDDEGAAIWAVPRGE